MRDGRNTNTDNKKVFAGTTVVFMGIALFAIVFLIGNNSQFAQPFAPRLTETPLPALKLTVATLFPTQAPLFSEKELKERESVAQTAIAKVNSKGIEKPVATVVFGTPGPNVTLKPNPTWNPTQVAQEATAMAAYAPPVSTKEPDCRVTPKQCTWLYQKTSENKWRQYVDPNVGWYFEYPADWHIENGYELPGFDLKTQRHYSIDISNVDYEKQIIYYVGKSNSVAGIGISAQHESDIGNYKDLESYIKESVSSPDSGVERVQIRPITVYGVKGFQYLEINKRFDISKPGFLHKVVFSRDGVLYTIGLGSLESDATISIFNRVVQSFRLSN